MIDPIHLLKVALDTSLNAYAPYSEYRVGAALLCEDGTIFAGCNVENASYGMSICAERNAVFAAIAAGKRKFKAIAVISSGQQIPYPCGACRQVLMEFCSTDLPTYVARSGSLSGTFEATTLGELLPHTFKL